MRDNGIDVHLGRFPAGSLARQKLLRQSAGFDAVFLHKKRLNPLDAFWLCRYARKVIYDFDDAVMYDDKNPDRPSCKRQRAFKRTIKLADMVIAGNKYLAEHAREFNTNVEIVPTGLDINSYKCQVAPKNDSKIRLVWIGSRSTLKYLSAIIPALEEIGVRFDNVILRIICDEFFEMQKMQVEKRLWSLERQALDLATGDIGLAPLPDNRFTCGKCGFKILQYASAGLPVIASPVGVNSDYVRNNTTGLFATDIHQWIERIVQLVKNPQLRREMGGKNLDEAKKFDVAVIGSRLVELVTKCIFPQ